MDQTVEYKLFSVNASKNSLCLCFFNFSLEGATVHCSGESYHGAALREQLHLAPDRVAVWLQAATMHNDEDMKVCN